MGESAATFSGQWDDHWMQVAITQAQHAADQGEVPVGAVLVANTTTDHPGEEVARAANAPIGAHDAAAHAEISVLRAAGQVRRNYRLPQTTLYVTLEPCMMCAGALIHARVERLVYGADEPKAGAVVSHPLLGQHWLNHRIAVTGGVLAEACGRLLQDFFAQRRHRQPISPSRAQH